MLTRLVYHSENHLGHETGKMIADLNAIMDSANRNNEKNGVTGALIFDTLWFVQILEGERVAVSETLRRIMADGRHDAVTVMDVRPIAERQFGNWWMGLALMRGDDAGLRANIRSGRLDPRMMSGEQAVALALDLAKSGLNRKLAASAA